MQVNGAELITVGPLGWTWDGKIDVGVYAGSAQDEIVTWNRSSAKTATLGLITESVTLFGVGPVKSKAVGLLSETDTPQPVVHVKSRTLGLATETDTQFAIARKGAPLGLIVETETVFPITRRLTKTLGLIVETDGFPPEGPHIVPRKLKGLGLVAETDTPLSPTRRKSKLIGLATETDTAQPVLLVFRNRIELGLIVTVDQVFGMRAIKAAPPGGWTVPRGRYHVVKQGAVVRRVSGR